jgi:hypothetical protein
MLREKQTTSRSRIGSLAVLGLSLALLLPALPARAHGGGHGRRAKVVRHHKHVVKHRGHSHHRHVSRSVRVVHTRRTVVVPHRIQVHQAPAYRAYYHDRVYHRGHGHFHMVYRFPVAGPHGVVYQPRVYCEGGLFVGAGFPVGRGFVRIGLRF